MSAIKVTILAERACFPMTATDTSRPRGALVAKGMQSRRLSEQMMYEARNLPREPQEARGTLRHRRRCHLDIDYGFEHTDAVHRSLDLTGYTRVDRSARRLHCACTKGNGSAQYSAALERCQQKGCGREGVLPKKSYGKMTGRSSREPRHIVN